MRIRNLYVPDLIIITHQLVEIQMINQTAQFLYGHFGQNHFVL